MLFPVGENVEEFGEEDGEGLEGLFVGGAGEEGDDVLDDGGDDFDAFVGVQVVGFDEEEDEFVAVEGFAGFQKESGDEACLG